MYVCIYIYIQTHTPTHIHKNKHMCTNTYIYVQTHVYMYVYTHAYLHTSTYVFIYRYMYVYLCVCVYIYIYVYIYLCIYLYMYIYAYIHVYLIYVCVYIHTYIYVYVFVCIYIYIYVSAQSFLCSWSFLIISSCFPPAAVWMYSYDLLLEVLWTATRGRCCTWRTLQPPHHPELYNLLVYTRLRSIYESSVRQKIIWGFIPPLETHNALQRPPYTHVQKVQQVEQVHQVQVMRSQVFQKHNSVTGYSKSSKMCKSFSIKKHKVPKSKSKCFISHVETEPLKCVWGVKTNGVNTTTGLEDLECVEVAAVHSG